MIIALHEFSPDDHEPEAETDRPRLRRLLHRILRASAQHWISVGDDGRSDSDRGILTSATGGYRAWLTLSGAGPAYTLRIRVNAGRLISNTPAILSASIALLQPNNSVRVIPDFEENELVLESFGDISDFIGSESVFLSLLHELKQTLDDTQLQSIVTNRSTSARK